MDTSIRQFIKYIATCITIIVIVCLIFGSLGLLTLLGDGLIPHKHTIITDVAEYKIITGNRENRLVDEMIGSFFPEEIKDTFSDVTYVYHAIKESGYTFEAYLEFKIEDEEEFEEYINSICSESEWQIFRYDPRFCEYNIVDGLELVDSGDGMEYWVEWAEINKILISNEQNRVIYIAIGAKHDGYVDARELSTFFDRFNINPVEYEESAITFLELCEMRENAD